jgi:hypothetical protein
MSVAEIEAEKIGVGGRIGWIQRWIGAPRTSSPVRLTLRVAPRAVAVKPIADRATRQLKISTDITEGNACRPELKGTLANLRGMHISIV